MKYAVLILAPALLAGCASSNYGSWLDAMGRPVRPPAAMSDEEARSLGEQALALRTHAANLRLQLAQETDRVQRFLEYDELRRIGNELAPIEQHLRDAGRAPRPLLPQDAS